MKLYVMNVLMVASCLHGMENKELSEAQHSSAYVFKDMCELHKALSEIVDKDNQEHTLQHPNLPSKEIIDLIVNGGSELGARCALDSEFLTRKADDQLHRFTHHPLFEIVGLTHMQDVISAIETVVNSIELALTNDTYPDISWREKFDAESQASLPASPKAVRAHRLKTIVELKVEAAKIKDLR